jgi:hypothetical protein
MTWRKRKQRKRLSEKTPKGDAIVRTTTINEIVEVDPKRSTRLAIGHKSNRKVLNQAAARMGQSLDTLGDFKLNLNNLENLKAA